MAKGNGNGNSREVDLLIRIAERLDSIEGQMAEGFKGVNTRLDGVLKLSGEKYREIERRLEAVEKHLGINH